MKSQTASFRPLYAIKFFFRRIVFIACGLLALVLSGCCIGNCGCDGDPSPKISVFSSWILNIARERNVSISKAADMLYELGVRGFDANYADKRLELFASTRLKPINLYGFPKFFAADNGRADCDRYVATAVRYGVPRIMCMPQPFTGGIENEAEMLKNISGLRYLVSIAKPHGIMVMIEPVGGRVSPCSRIGNVMRFMTEIPELRFAYDPGNVYFANRGESVDDLWAFAGGRLEHVHLKDLDGEDHHRYVTLGMGKADIGRIVREVGTTGYDGWWTLENPAGDTYDEAVRQIAVLRSWLADSRR